MPTGPLAHGLGVGPDSLRLDVPDVRARSQAGPCRRRTAAEHRPSPSATSASIRPTPRSSAARRRSPLTPKAFGVLELLVARAGQLVTKDEFLDRLWPGVFVGDAVLKVCVREIRQRARRRSPRADVHRDRPQARLPLHRAGVDRRAGRAAGARRPTPSSSRRRRPATRRAATSASPTRWSATGPSISCSSWAGSRTSTTSGPSRRSRASCAGSRRSRA